VDRSVDDEHRAGLRGEIRVRPLGEKTFRLEDASCAVADVENAVRLLEKVRYRARSTGERRSIGSRQFPSIFDIEADRRKIVLVHAAIHGKLQRLALALKVARQSRKCLVRLAIGAAPKEAQVLLSWVEAASDVGCAFERRVPASLGLGCSRHRKTKQNHGAKLDHQRKHA
jgi:hypothetical protein